MKFVFKNADESKRRYIAEAITKIGKGNISAEVFTFRELCTATKNFSHDNLIGEGGFGRVYKGELVKSDDVILLQYSIHFFCFILK